MLRTQRPSDGNPSLGVAGKVVSPDFQSVLKTYGEYTRARLKRYIQLDGASDDYEGLVSDYPRRGGKMLRPCLLIASACAFGANPSQVVDLAAALEMLHNALLIHDDIQDESDDRRGRPTLHKLHGLPLALFAGDALAVRSILPLIDRQHDFGPRLTLRLLEETAIMSLKSAEGQALELGWRRDNVCTLDETDYLKMVLAKTCWLAFIFPCRVGALVATRGRAPLEPFVRFGFFVGAAFQVHDDILNLTSSPGVYGKEINGDLWEGKKTLMLVHLRERVSPVERRRLDAIFQTSRSERREEDIVWIRERMDHHGSIDYARQIALGLAGAARHEFEMIFGALPESPDKTFIRDLTSWVIRRPK